MAKAKQAQTVRTAIRQKSVDRRQSVLQRMFAFWFDAFVYNQIWEDPRVDLEALEIDRNSRILTISSGGCNALNYLLAGPASVTAVDLNQNHIYLLNLKKALAEFLPDYDSFFQFFGYGKGEQLADLYFRHAAEHLDGETRRFWESGYFGFDAGRRIDYFENRGLYDHSRNGFFLRVFHRIARIHGCCPERILEAETLEDQKRLYKEEIKRFFNSRLMRVISRLPVTLFGLGIPPQQFEEIRRDLDAGSTIPDVYLERTSRLATQFPINDNYFAWQAFGRKYDTEKRIAVPEYLKAENFEKLKQRIGRLETAVGSVTEIIQNTDKGRFNRFVFLDAQDWMTGEAQEELWSAIAARTNVGARIIFRTAGRRSPIENNLTAETRGCFDYSEEESLLLFEKDRSSIYGGFHLYVKK